MEYNEFDEIAYIRKKVEDLPAEYDNDQLLNILDIIWDWQEDNGFLDIDTEDDMSPEDIEKLDAHAKKLLAKDKGNIVKPQHVMPIIVAALEYEAQL